MTDFLIASGCITLLILLAIAAARYMDRFCKFCGCKMNRFYDSEEDAEVYQCPNCGRSYIIK
jgi:predicted RNA-binding Zn-ribbon protein involved in translation (DUF1610 family)